MDWSQATIPGSTLKAINLETICKSQLMLLAAFCLKISTLQISYVAV